MTRKNSGMLRTLYPPGRKGPAVLVIHSWWGLTASFLHYGQLLADAGFSVGLPDLFDGETASTEAAARRLRAKPRSTPYYKTLIRSIGELLGSDGVKGKETGIIGFSMGGHWAVWLSQRPELPIRDVVLYYAARAGNFRDSRSSYLAHFAEHDPWVSAAARRRMEAAIRDANRPYRDFDYPGTGHWFAESDRTKDYAAEAAAAALTRTISHLRGERF